ncbi:MAG: hypothetical protein ACQEXJ_19110 [Myxococcota bacterium]
MKGSQAIRALAAASALLLACSGEEGEAPCRDESCPVDQTCVEGACRPIEVPTATGELGQHTQVALRDDGRMVVVTWDRTHTNLVLALERPDGSLDKRIVAGWRFDDHQLLDTRAGRWPSVAVDDQDVVHLAWHDGFESALKVARLTPDDDLAVETVDGAGEADRGTWTSLAVAPDGTVHVAYRDESARRLRHAERTPDGTWHVESVDGCAGEADCPTGDEDYGEWASLALVGGEPRVAFYDRLRGDLKMAARQEDGTWQVTTLDGRDPSTGMDTGDVGRFASVAVDPKSRLGVAYYDATRGALRFLFSGGAEPAPVVVDDGVYHDETSGSLRNHPVGQHVALRFDGQERAHMVYLDAGRIALKRAIVEGSSVVERVDLTDLPAGGWIDFRLTPDGTLRGAWGPWQGTGDLRTRLETFHLPPEGAP